MNVNVRRISELFGALLKRQSGIMRFLVDCVGMLMILLVLVVLFGVLSDNFLTQGTFNTIANRVPTLAVIAVGMTFVLIIAGIDLSVGSVMAFSGAVVGLALVDGNMPLWLGALLGMLVGGLCGLVSGVISVFWSIPSFIVTLGMLEIARGGAYLTTDSKTKFIGESVEVIGAPIREVLGLTPAYVETLPRLIQAILGLSPAFFIAICVVIIAQVVLSRTVFGRYMISIGANEQAVRLSGINPSPIKIIVFANVGLLTGLGAIFHCSRLSSADPNAGVGLELAAIASVVIGGTSLMGGRGSVIKSFFGVLIIATLEAGLAHVGASDPIKRIITGAVIVVAVIFDASRAEIRHKLARAFNRTIDKLGLWHLLQKWFAGGGR
jgi:ribose transport system permease protein